MYINVEAEHLTRCCCAFVACIYMDMTDAIASQGGSSKVWDVSFVKSGQQVMFTAVSCTAYLVM